MFKKHWVFFINLAVFIFLLARNPFSQRTLIPNFEPYPDTIHYVNSAISYAEGHDLQIFRDGRGLKTTVPPLYSIILIPLFMIYSDPRMFYFTNLILAFLSFFMFYKITLLLLKEDKKGLDKSRDTTINSCIAFTALFLYVTNYFFYWYPSLAMAENLTLALFMGGVYILLVPATMKKIMIAGLLAVAFYMTKYASLPLAGFYFLSYLVKTLIEYPEVRIKGMRIHPSLMLIVISVITFLIYSWWEWGTKGSTLLITLINSISPQSVSGPKVTTGEWFSLSYIPRYLPQYLKAMMGGERIRFLWDSTPIIPLYVGIPALIGLALSLFQRRYRFLALSLILMLFSSILFMSTFYSQDMRYLYHAIPTLLIGFVLFWKILSSFVINRKNALFQRVILSMLILLFTFAFLTSAIRLKKQIMLNLKYAETPWYYISVLELNKYFAKTSGNYRRAPVVISSMIPYYIDFFSNKQYALLPLSLSQEFRGSRKEAWGDYDYTNLIALYHKVIYRGFPLFVHNYGLGNEQPLKNDFKKIQNEFDLELVQSGCFDACNIWRVKEKKGAVIYIPN